MNVLVINQWERLRRRDKDREKKTRLRKKGGKEKRMEREREIVKERMKGYRDKVVGSSAGSVDEANGEWDLRLKSISEGRVTSQRACKA